MALKTTLSFVGTYFGAGMAFAWASLLLGVGVYGLFTNNSNSPFDFIAAGVWTFLGIWILEKRAAAPKVSSSG